MNFNIGKLRLRCEQSKDDIIGAASALGDTVRLDTADGPLVWVRRGSPVLACVHLDYVDVSHRWGYDRKRGRVYTPRLDDRAGVFVLLDVLPGLGILPDLLLTDSEEIGRSTAKRYCGWAGKEGGPASVDYNWLAQFDRRGDDAVTYNYSRSDEWEAALKGGGFKLGHGSFSDIAALYDLGRCGVNIGVGYHGEHSTSCYGDLDELERNLVAFRKFWGDNLGRKFEFTEEMRNKYAGGGYTYWKQSYDDYGGGSQVGFEFGGGGRAVRPVVDSSFNAYTDEYCRNCGAAVHWLDMGDQFCQECEWLLSLSRADDEDEATRLAEAAEWAEYLNRFERG